MRGGRRVVYTAGAGGAGRGLRRGGCVQEEGCVQRGSTGIFLPNGAGRIPKSGWVERRGEDCIDASSGAGRGLREDRE